MAIRGAEGVFATTFGGVLAEEVDVVWTYGISGHVELGLGDEVDERTADREVFRLRGNDGDGEGNGMVTWALALWRMRAGILHACHGWVAYLCDVEVSSA